VIKGLAADKHEPDSSQDLLDAALAYTRRGWLVFPLQTMTNGQCSCGALECDRAGKHPDGNLAPDGLNNATTDEVTIRQWWTTRPRANIGIVTGSGSGFLALDIDPGKNGDEGLRDLERIYGPLPETVESLTGGGGRHLLFTYPNNGGVIRNSVSLLGPGLDIRATGGYVVVPPSLHASGRVYAWEVTHHPDDVPLAPLPVWLRDRLLALATRPPATASTELKIAEGHRNDMLMRIAGSLRHWGASQGTIAATLLNENSERCVPPLSDAEVRKIAESVVRYAPAEISSLNGEVTQATQQLSEEHESKPQSISWPNPPDEAAFHGLGGDVVRLITPHSEADRVALLVQFLAAFGNIIGRKPHFVAEAAYHALNLFLVLVGVTSKARKGSSWAQIMRPYSAVEEVWARDRLQSGLSSGEGLIWAVRDPITKNEPIMEKGKRTGEYAEVIVDAGVDDKRLLVQEAEFSSPLRMCERDGNTLSALIRQAWETGNLRALTKNSPAKSTGAHISIVGHITRDELRRYLNTTEAGNGFGNRFLWFCARRSKCLPEGGNLEQEALAPLILQLKEAINFAKTVSEIDWELNPQGVLQTLKDKGLEPIDPIDPKQNRIPNKPAFKVRVKRLRTDQC